MYDYIAYEKIMDEKLNILSDKNHCIDLNILSHKVITFFSEFDAMFSPTHSIHYAKCIIIYCDTYGEDHHR